MARKTSTEIEIGGRKLVLETGGVAEQANASVLARYGDTMVLATVVSKTLSEHPGYFPLYVEYVERLYAGGRIKGSRWVKREGKTSDEGILSARLIDRSIRPLFPKGYQNDEVQIVSTVLSVDSENDPALLAAVASSAALAISDIPWNGPVGIVRVGMRAGSFFVNPTDSELEYSDLDLILAADKENIFMIEAGAKEVSEDKLIEAIKFGQAEIQKIINGIAKLRKDIGKAKRKIENEDGEIRKLINEKFGESIRLLVQDSSILQTKVPGLEEIALEIHESFPDFPKHKILYAVEAILKDHIREKLLAGKRLDGRKSEQIRDIEAQVAVLPRTHGSAIFSRGKTQVLTVTTLGSPSMEQLIESPEGEETKRYMHHYFMPAYATGETGRFGYPSRREIGHGALAERALLPVIPPEDKFPYTIRVVSEVLSSNGSTSMASVCGSTLSLMDAGVPIAKPVAGIAMGLLIESKKVVILSDISGIEDAMGDMDFKVAGTRDGVTAIQLDVKTNDLTAEVLERALLQAKEGRIFILDKMTKTISSPRQKISIYAPKIVVLHVPVEKIGDVIGPGGRTIRKIISETSAQVEIEDDGSISISGVDEESVSRAVSIIEGLTREVKPGEIFEGEVKRIVPFGAFVEILPGKEGLVHISDMSENFVEDPNQVVSIGQKVKVKVKEIDELGRINLSMFFGQKPALRLGRKEERLQRRGGQGPHHFPPSRFLTTKKSRF